MTKEENTDKQSEIVRRVQLREQTLTETPDNFAALTETNYMIMS